MVPLMAGLVSAVGLLVPLTAGRGSLVRFGARRGAAVPTPRAPRSTASSSPAHGGCT